MMTDTYGNKTKAELVEELEDLRRRLAEFERTESERRHTVETLRASEEKYRILLDESSDPIFTFYPDGQYRYVNLAFADGVGKKLEQIIGKKIWDVFPKEEADKRFAIVKWVFESGQSKVIEVRVPRPDGDRYYVTTAKPILNDDRGVISVICISKDITERKNMENQWTRMAQHDMLTDLPNRVLLDDRLGHAMAAIKRSDGHGAMMFLDLDNFKLLNDTHGHKVGDLLLIEVANRLKSCVREADTVARFAGDEFVVMISELDVDKAASTAQAGIIAEKVRNTLAKPYVLPVQREGEVKAAVEHQCTASIGVVLFGRNETSKEDILKGADTAMYQAKEAGRNLIRFCDLKN